MAEQRAKESSLMSPHPSSHNTCSVCERGRTTAREEEALLRGCVSAGGVGSAMEIVPEKQK